MKNKLKIKKSKQTPLHYLSIKEIKKTSTITLVEYSSEYKGNFDVGSFYKPTSHIYKMKNNNEK